MPDPRWAAAATFMVIYVCIAVFVRPYGPYGGRLAQVVAVAGCAAALLYWGWEIYQRTGRRRPPHE
jgi:hypothetical protein